MNDKNDKEDQDDFPISGNRRRFLQTGFGLVAGAALLGMPDLAEAQKRLPKIPAMVDGSNDPFPIPQLDKNGSHNESPKPGTEPSNIFHFKGRVARCNDFVGMGTDNKGNRLAFGSPTTDYSFMQGEYFAARRAQTGAFTHI